ncbi:hypothetical protein SAMN05216266_10875 [Amycolatopsis marina]|uniref:Lipoprotein n=1 Tax=Amycolatopsis marina TaxID=490629 RepID=A0A1I1A0N1_9PSEU|nr:hypothetical protein [Amycolatopsis marina]SFB31515.1 hypothetical protein SAMN05216266_10875 [Amycolatopsis marina]
MTNRPDARSGRRRARALAALATGVALVTSACGTAHTATPVPDGAEAAEYVSAKFADKLQHLSEDFTGNEPRKSTLDSFIRIDDKKADDTITAVQFGSPPARLSKNHSNRDSGTFLDSYHPAGSEVEYLRLGPHYSSLAPTPWVSMPYTGHNYGECFWAGYNKVCKMLNSVAAAVEAGRAAKEAKSLPDGSVELTAEIPLRTFLEYEVIGVPEKLLANVSEQMRSEPLTALIVLGPDDKLQRIEMNGTVTGDGHELEVRMAYQVLEPPTENDLPPVPDDDEVTVLKDRAAVSDFYDRLGKIQNDG